jgi:merlin
VSHDVFRMQYIQQSQSLQEQLKTIKSEIDTLKVEEKQSHLDSIHEQNLMQGTNKYATLGRVCISQMSDIVM